MTPAPRILFGEHSTQRPAVERLVDRRRFDVAFGTFEDMDFAGVDLVVPLRIEEFAAARRANGDRRRAVLPSAELVELCDDKLLFNRRLIELGFGGAVPALLLDDTDAYPFVRKARRGDFGAGITVVRGPGEDRPAPDSFAQVAVAGADEYVLHLLRVDGVVRYSLCYHYDMGEPLAVRGAGGAARGIHPADPAPAWDTCLAVLDALGFEGTCCFNYKLQGGRPMILELNPRFGGSLVGDVNGYLAAHLEALG